MAVGKLVTFRNATINKAFGPKPILIFHTYREVKLHFLKLYFLQNPPFGWFLS